jgi:hypothetical protein
MCPDIPTGFDGLQSLPIAPSDVEQVATLGMASVVLRVSSQRRQRAKPGTPFTAFVGADAQIAPHR